MKSGHRQSIPGKLRHEVFKRDGYRCRECGATNKETILEIDHIVPVAKGGTNDISNLQTLCKTCNRAKYTRTWVGGTYDDFKPKYLSESKQTPYLTEAEEKRVKLYNKLKNDLTDEQLELLYNYFPGDIDNKYEMILYLVDRFSENQINQILIRLEKGKEIEDYLSYNLTDAQLKALYEEFYPLELSKEDICQFLSTYYGEDNIDQIFSKIHDEREDFLFKKLCFAVDDTHLGTLSYFAPGCNNKNLMLEYISKNYPEEEVNHFISGNFDVVKPDKIIEICFTVHQDFINEGRIASVEEIMDRANIKYKIIRKNRLYGIYGYVEALELYKLNQQQKIEIKNEIKEEPKKRV